MTPSFKRKLEVSRCFEKAFGRYLRHLGYHVIPTYDYSGEDGYKVPKLLGNSSSKDVVLPDLLTFSSSGSRWFEVKVKNEAAFNRKRGVRVTGLDLDHWTAYRSIKDVTGIAVTLVFVHLKEGEMRAMDIGKIERLIVDKCGPNFHCDFKRGALFFDYDSVPIVGDVSDILSYMDLSDRTCVNRVHKGIFCEVKT